MDLCAIGHAERVLRGRDAASKDERERILTGSIQQQGARGIVFTASLRYDLFVMVTRDGAAEPSFLFAAKNRESENLYPS